MVLPTSQTPSPVTGDDRNLVNVDESYLAPSFEDRVQMFWESHGRTVITGLVLVGVFFAARSAFGLYVEHRENAVRAAYAGANDASSLKAFALAHPSAPLAGAAWLRIADEAYAAGDYAVAASAYASAAPLLKAEPLGARARLGESIALLLAGDASAASVMEKLAGDTALPAVIRAESAYHLAVLARDAADSEAVARWVALTLSVDTSGLWAQRASRIQAVPAVEAASAAQPSNDEAPMVSFPAATK